MKYLIATILSIVGIVGLVLGKLGTILSTLGFIAGLIGLLPAISFWWILAFMLTFVVGLVSYTCAALIVKG